jgi:hypothetical protein
MKLCVFFIFFCIFSYIFMKIFQEIWQKYDQFDTFYHTFFVYFCIFTMILVRFFKKMIILDSFLCHFKLIFIFFRIFRIYAYIQTNTGYFSYTIYGIRGTIQNTTIYKKIQKSYIRRCLVPGRILSICNLPALGSTVQCYSRYFGRFSAKMAFFLNTISFLHILGVFEKRQFCHIFIWRTYF